MLPAQPNQSLIDGLACLQALAMAAEPVGSRALSRQLGLEPTRVNRLLKTLAHLGIAAQTPGRQYVSGPAMHVLAAQSLFGSGLLKRALDPLHALRAPDRTIALGVLWRWQVCYLYHAGPGIPDAVALGRVGLYPATSSGIGMALLASQSDEQIRHMFEHESVPAGTMPLAPLLRELHAIRRRGYAVTPVPDNITTLAFAIGAPAYAAVAISGKFTPAKMEAAVSDLRVATARIDAGAIPSTSFKTATRKTR